MHLSYQPLEKRVILQLKFQQEKQQKCSYGVLTQL